MTLEELQEYLDKTYPDMHLYAARQHRTGRMYVTMQVAGSVAVKPEDDIHDTEHGIIEMYEDMQKLISESITKVKHAMAG